MCLMLLVVYGELCVSNVCAVTKVWCGVGVFGVYLGTLLVVLAPTQRAVHLLRRT